MNTNYTVSKVAVVAVALMAIALIPGLASAQHQVRGTFTLSSTTYWGTSVLPAGDYSFTVLPAGNGDVQALRISGEKGEFNFAAIKDRNATAKDNSLNVRRGHGATIVTALNLAANGTTMRFASSASAKEVLAKNGSGMEVAKLAIGIVATE